MTRRAPQTLFWNMVGVLIALAVWEAIGRYFGSNKLAPPSEVAVTYLELLREGRMLRELAGSLQQMLVGFGFACLLGMPQIGRAHV